MLFIKKQKASSLIKNQIKKTIQTPDNGFEEINLPGDADKLRKIFVRDDQGVDSSLLSSMQEDIDEELHLNGILDANGKVVFDTATKLVAHRKSIYDSICTQFDRWDKKNCLTSDFLKEVIGNLEKQLNKGEITEPYIGVRLYFYRRKYEKLKKRGM